MQHAMLDVFVHAIVTIEYGALLLSTTSSEHFIGYRSRASWRQACDVAACRARAKGTVCTYAFPSWLVNYAISVSHSGYVVSHHNPQ